MPMSFLLAKSKEGSVTCTNSAFKAFTFVASDEASSDDVEELAAELLSLLLEGLEGFG